MNYVAAMNLGLKRLSELPVSVRLIREIHAQLMHGVRGGHLTPGELRSSQNWIGRMGATLTGTRVLEMLYNKPIVAVADVASLNGTSFAAANTLMVRLEQLGILNEVTGFARNRRFRYEPYVRLFADG